MDRETEILKDRVQVLPLGRHRLQTQERIGGQEDKKQECDANPCLYGKHIGFERFRQVATEDGNKRAKKHQNEQPQQHRAFVVSPHARQLVKRRHQRMGVFPDVANGKIRDGIGPGQCREGQGHQQEHHDGAERGNIHQRTVVATRADHRQGGDDQPDSERQNQNIVAELVDHFVAPVLSAEAPSVAAPEGCPPSSVCCQRPLSFSRSATSFGM